jgi:hypothetical protein
MDTRAFSKIPESYLDLLRGMPIAHVATLRADGRLSVNPIGVLWDGTALRFSTRKDRRKYQSLRRDPRIALSIVDPADVRRYLEIRGTAEIADDVGRAFVNRIAREFMGIESGYPDVPPDAERVVVMVRIEQAIVPEVGEQVRAEQRSRGR